MSKGIQLFNDGNHFEAHEEWEVEWKCAEGSERIRLKACIQACGVFIHLRNEKLDPARRLAIRALQLFAEADACVELHVEKPIRLEIPGLVECLTEVVALITQDEASLAQHWSRIEKLRAHLLERGSILENPEQEKH